MLAVLASRVLPADAMDGAAATHELLGGVQVVFVDSAFNGVFRQRLARRHSSRSEKPMHVLARKINFGIHAWRWIVERTFT